MWRVLSIGILWGIASFGALQLNKIPLGHTVCGPWGCGPTTQSLLAIHSFWLVTTLTGVALLRLAFPTANWLRIGVGVTFTALVLAFAVGVWDFLTWRPDPWNLDGMYLWQRFLYRLATLPDFPILQVAMAGVVLMLTGGARSRRGTERTEEPNEALGPATDPIAR